MLKLEKSDAFAFEVKPLVTESISCLFDIRARMGRCLTVQQLRRVNDGSKIFGCDFLVAQFANNDNALKFLEDEKVRFGLLGNTENFAAVHADETTGVVVRDSMFEEEVTVLCSARVAHLVFRFSIGLLDIQPGGDALQLSQAFINDVLERSKNVDLRT